jgi:SH2 domain
MEVEMDIEGEYEQAQPWFHKDADREAAVNILKDQECGTFLVRPSSIVGNYVISRVDENGEVRHRLIYRLFPGFSPKQAPDEPYVRYDYLCL